MRLVLDTNTVVSGLLWNSLPTRLIEAGLQGRVELFATPALLLELEDVLPRRKLARRVAVSGMTVEQLAARYALFNLKTYQGIPIVGTAEARRRIAPR